MQYHLLPSSPFFYFLLLFAASLAVKNCHWRMEESINNPPPHYSTNENQMDTETLSLSKKRKFPAEQLGLPLSKHKSQQSSYIESGSITNDSHNDLSPSLMEVQSTRRLSRDNSQSGSPEDNDSFYGGNATTMSISDKVRNDIWNSKAGSSDEPSTSSINWASTCSTKSLYSLERMPMERPSSSSEKMESSYNIGEERDLDHKNFGSHLSPYFDDDNDLEFISHADDNMEQYVEDGGEDVIYSNGVIPSNYLLPSDNEQGAEKLTIDKEFEEYFSSLML